MPDREYARCLNVCPASRNLLPLLLLRCVHAPATSAPLRILPLRARCHCAMRVLLPIADLVIPGFQSSQVIALPVGRFSHGFLPAFPVQKKTYFMCPVVRHQCGLRSSHLPATMDNLAGHRLRGLPGLWIERREQRAASVHSRCNVSGSQPQVIPPLPSAQTATGRQHLCQRFQGDSATYPKQGSPEVLSLLACRPPARRCIRSRPGNANLIFLTISSIFADGAVAQQINREVPVYAA